MKVYLVEVERIEDGGKVIIENHYVLGNSVQSVAATAQIDLIELINRENRQLKGVQYVLTVIDDYRGGQ